MEGRASKNYKKFVEDFLLYQSIFDNNGDLFSILQLPYPLYTDIILRQLDEKKRQQKLLDDRMRTIQTKQRKAPKRR